MFLKLGCSFLREASRSNRKTLTNAFVPLMLVRNLSTQTNNVTNRVITRNLELRQRVDDCDDGGQRPLACLFSWLMAKRQHLHRYGDFYLQQGFDVLNVQIHVDQAVLPARAQSCVQQALDYLSHRAVTVGPTPLLVHAFSIGAYLYGEMLIKMAAESDRYGDIVSSVGGEIFDSGVDFEGIPTGFGKAVTNNRRLQKLLRASLEQYLKVTYEHTTKYYLRSSAMFHNNYMKCPSLVMYSLTDAIGSQEGNERAMRRWRALGREVYSHAFENAPHVSLMWRYPAEYKRLQQEFIDRIPAFRSVESPVKVSARAL
ncbi:PREDICTED: uncharacterized protein LOC106814225 [Priapulus caudatus]|uniref:Uncharacterized protein LOC106814225 n=1 Tax=Priapulus caudatus TaxID=37621 RepID=A0ABM1EP90_PRICU|nr:PREDICTED: uncharacterized protein LOC106814225 [Priapulus caudatus]